MGPRGWWRKVGGEEFIWGVGCGGGGWTSVDTSRGCVSWRNRGRGAPWIGAGEKGARGLDWDACGFVFVRYDSIAGGECALRHGLDEKEV